MGIQYFLKEAAMTVTNCTELAQQARLQNLEMKRKAMEVILASDDGKNSAGCLQTDAYIQHETDADPYANYTKSGVLQTEGGAVSKEDIWEYLSTFTGLISDGKFTVKGQTCHVSQVEKMGKEILKTPMAVNNVLTLESGVFYGISTNDGGAEHTWGMNVTEGTYGKMLSISGSEVTYAAQHGITQEELGRWTSFFRFVSCNSGDAAAAGIYLGLSEEQVKGMLKTLGFQPGMCTIMADGEKSQFYYSNNGRVYPKYHYDGAYDGMTNADNSRDYEVGDEFNYNGKIYAMDEEGHINIPYGEDIFNCLSRPVGKLAKQMQTAST